VTARIGRIPTLIFDEVDVGIGGGVPRLSRAAAHTGRFTPGAVHHPSGAVAAQGHRHLQVTKETAANTTVTHIGPLSAKERVQEIARMLAVSRSPARPSTWLPRC